MLSGSPLVPVSWGELADKLTILEIKSGRPSSPQALANVRHELTLLLEQWASQREIELLAGALRNRLRGINQVLWELEDRIRSKEAKSEFDAEFIDAARGIYRMNDERSAVKRQINHLLNSELTEEKQYQAY